jgi:hypothetical protein
MTMTMMMKTVTTTTTTMVMMATGAMIVDSSYVDGDSGDNDGGWQ